MKFQRTDTKNDLQSRFTVERFFKSFFFKSFQIENDLQSRFTVERFFKSFQSPEC